MQQITVSRMDLDELEARLQRAMRRRFEGRDHGLDALFRERNRRRTFQAERNRARAEHLPSALLWLQRRAAVPGHTATRLPPRMRKLNACHRALAVNEPRDARQRLGM